MPNALIDNHHAELTHSLELLFGRRLGYTVLQPIGTEWYERGFWKVFDHPETVRQYLSMERADKSAHSRPTLMTAAGPTSPDPDLHYIWDPTKELYERAVTLETLLKKGAALVIASIPAHAEPFRRLVRERLPAAKFIFQMGNMFPEFDLATVDNILNSTDRRTPFFKHALRYSQEFSLDVFSYTEPTLRRLVVDLVHYSSGEPLYQRCKALMPEFHFEAYGAGNETGSISRNAEVAAKMKEADFIWHLKKGGDGYGHVVHNAAALGRPVIISMKDYRGKRFGKFIEDGVTCVTVDGLDAEALAHKIRHYGEPERLKKMSRTLYARFRELVDFDRDVRNVRKFLEKLR